ncbi:phosphatidylcholine-sterol O-acyltransferase-like protein [Stemphylium lycopersici]|uniref:Phosphatidylcholine-sterol O-acyltransferase-like protein n=1 Tax=Stemphylium lycopersici TaxID=183478 RepID=A0A364N1P8_STELY|nr:phosphatidylcholine-sterol O-acyltransferase-like protein [Stemphylium lycopersici]
MAESPTTTPSNHTRRQNALASIQFASIVDDDLTPSEDETAEERALELETAQSAIGVSIGQQQTRLTSPKTPAAEKAAALDATEDGAFFDGWQEATEASPERKPAAPPTGTSIPHIDASKDAHKPDARQKPTQTASNDDRERKSHPQTRLPSPWRAGPKTFQKEKPGDHRAALRQHLQNGRRRASSGGSMSETMRKYMPFNLPTSITKSYKDLHFSLPSLSALSLDTGPKHIDRRRRDTLPIPARTRSIPQHDGTHQSTPVDSRSVSRNRPDVSQQPNTAPIPQREFSDSSTSTLSPPPSQRQSERPAPRLRRSNSEGSLLVYRSRSFASSLGDDSRFESVQEQVNSRLKAIRDSWQDSNFKLPSPSLPNFNLGSSTDLFRSRNSSAAPKARDVEDGPSHRVSFRASIPGTASRRDSLRAKRQQPRSGDADAETHPHFTQALQELEGDLVVLGGYRGSILRSAEPPHRQLWVPIKVGLNLRKVDLEVPLDPDADERMHETIIPSGMLTHIGPVDIAKRLFKRLKASDNARDGKLRVHNYGYDWRLSPHFLSRQMIRFLESLPCNQPGVPPEKRGATVIAHSLGGLIVRHVINQRPELVAGVLYAGVPQRCVNILGPFRNGDDVLLSSRVLTAQVNFSIRTSFALLPLDGKCFFNKHTKEEYPVDFFDVNTWKEHRLSPCIAAPLPRPDPPKDSTFSVSGLMNAVSHALPTFPPRKNSSARDPSELARNAANNLTEGSAGQAGMGPQMGHEHGAETSKEPNPATDVTIPYDKAIEYLTRTLAEVKAFKQELDHRPEHSTSNSYPPIAVIYGKSTPTVFGAKVESKEAIKRADVYDELAFASGDGVVLARAAMVPTGYSVVKGGVVSSDRGHVTLLGDLEAVGRCLHAIGLARKRGVGQGPQAQ